MRAMVAVLLMAGAACGPSQKLRQAEERNARTKLEITLKLCQAGRHLAAAGGGVSPSAVQACVDVAAHRETFLSACQASRGDAAACELAAQGVERAQ